MAPQCPPRLHKEDIRRRCDIIVIHGRVRQRNERPRMLLLAPFRAQVLDTAIELAHHLHGRTTAPDPEIPARGLDDLRVRDVREHRTRCGAERTDRRGRHRRRAGTIAPNEPLSPSARRPTALIRLERMLSARRIDMDRLALRRGCPAPVRLVCREGGLEELEIRRLDPVDRCLFEHLLLVLSVQFFVVHFRFGLLGEAGVDGRWLEYCSARRDLMYAYADAEGGWVQTDMPSAMQFMRKSPGQ